MEPMSVEMYVKKGGNYCPNCRSDEVHAHNIEWDFDVVWQEVRCKKCGSIWLDQYNLVAYRDLILRHFKVTKGKE